MWSVDERTVKREMAKLRAMGWLVLRRQGARGRVSVYGIDAERILMDTEPAWSKVGQDFVVRLSGPQAVPVPSTVVSLRPAAAPVQDGSIWPAVLARLHAQDQSLYTNWFSQLAFDRIDGGTVYLLAANRFQARFVSGNYSAVLMASLRAEDPSIGAVKIETT